MTIKSYIERKRENYEEYCDALIFRLKGPIIMFIIYIIGVFYLSFIYTNLSGINLQIALIIFAIYFLIGFLYSFDYLFIIIYAIMMKRNKNS